MNIEVQLAVPFAVGVPDEIARKLLDVLAAAGLGAADGPQGAGNLMVLVAQPVDINLPDTVVQDLQDAIAASISAPAVLGQPNPIPAPPPPVVAPPVDNQPQPQPTPLPTQVGGGPWVRNGVYWSDTNYEADLLQAANYIAGITGAPNIVHFLQAQSREEVGRGRLFTKQNNYWNMGAIDSNPQAAPTLTSPEAGGQAWLDFLGWNNPRSTYAAFKQAVRNGESDVYTLAALIRQGGWATDPSYAVHVSNNA